MSSFKNATLAKIKAAWVDELGEDLEEDIWDSALLRVNDSSSCARLSIIQFKILHRIHCSKARLAEIYPNTDASCDRCRNTPADLTHMFWSCSALTSYWFAIFKTLSEALDMDLQPCAVMAIFGTTDGRYCTIRKRSLLLTLLARRRILLHWKSKNPASVSLWFNDLM